MFRRPAHHPYPRRTRRAAVLALAGVLCALGGGTARGESEPSDDAVTAIKSTVGGAPWLPHYGWPAALLTVVVTYSGARLLRRRSGALPRVEAQLAALGVTSSEETPRLQCLPGSDLASAGWNRIVAALRQSGTAAGLEDRLSRAMSQLQEQKSDRVLNGLPDGIAVTDEQGRITFSNRAFRALVGDPEADPAGKEIEATLPFPDQVRRAPRGGNRPFSREILLGETSADGVLRVTRFPLAAAEGDAGAHVWQIRDVTQQKLAEEMRNQFVYSATHELRTPLANIKAYAETLMLTDGLDAEQQREFFNIINTEATRLARFVDDLLDISRMEAGSMTLDRQQTDMERLLAEAADKVRPQMAQRQITFEVSLPPKLPELHVDKDKLAAALVNLLGNAAKYTPEGGRVKLAVECDGRELQVHVEDTGYGISAEELPKLCTKFFRSADPRVRDVSGSGLGLSFTHEAIRLHGGRLNVTSELNRGSRFSMILPVA